VAQEVVSVFKKKLFDFVFTHILLSKGNSDSFPFNIVSLILFCVTIICVWALPSSLPLCMESLILAQAKWYIQMLHALNI